LSGGEIEGDHGDTIPIRIKVFGETLYAISEFIELGYACTSARSSAGARSNRWAQH
jgi:hypothetical protein